MAILLISDNFPPKTGGSGRWFWEIYRRFPRPEVVIAAGADPRQDGFDRTHDLRLTRLPLTFADWGVFNLRTLQWYWGVAQKLGRIARSEGVRQIHCGRCLPEGWIAWMLKQKCGIPYICYAHGEEVNTEAAGQPTGVLSSRQLRWMMRRVIGGADFVIANSRNTKQILMQGWGVPEHKARLMYPGVDTEVFVPAPRDAAARGRLGWGDRPVVLTVGRLETRKGQDQMIRALVAIRKTIPRVLYAVVGDGERREFLEALVRQEGLGEHVQFLGELSDRQLLSCYQQCDLFVLANRQVGNEIEGFGMVLLEAQACGKPVVAGTSGGTAETMQNGKTGRLVACEGPDELGAAVAELLGNPDLRDRMGQAARPWVVEHFDWEALSRQAERLFQRSGIRAAS